MDGRDNTGHDGVEAKPSPEALRASTSPVNGRGYLCPLPFTGEDDERAAFVR